jgi:hypothetical protein
LEDLHHSPINASKEQTNAIKEEYERSKKMAEVAAL